MQKNNAIYYVIILTVGIFVFIYLLFFSHNQTIQFNRLETQGIIDTAVIVRKFRGAKRKLYYEYVFKIENNNYNGFIQYSPSFGKISIGDSILIKYLPSNPDDINKPIYRNNQYILKIRE